MEGFICGASLAFVAMILGGMLISSCHRRGMEKIKAREFFLKDDKRRQLKRGAREHFRGVRRTSSKRLENPKALPSERVDSSLEHLILDSIQQGDLGHLFEYLREGFGDDCPDTIIELLELIEMTDVLNFYLEKEVITRRILSGIHSREKIVGKSLQELLQMWLAKIEYFVLRDQIEEDVGYCPLNLSQFCEVLGLEYIPDKE